MKRLIKFILLLAVIALTVSFALLNSQSVAIDYYFGTLELPLTVFVFIALVAGWCLGGLSFFKYIVKIKLESREANRAANLAETEVKNLRKLPLSNDY
jgi:putative membrane protein